MRFANVTHRQDYNEMANRYGLVDNEVEPGSALYVLAAIATQADTIRRHVDHRRVNFPALLEVAEAWSSGERTMLRLAAELFNASIYKFPLSECLAGLDGRNFTVAMTALRNRFDPTEED